MPPDSESAVRAKRIYEPVDSQDGSRVRVGSLTLLYSARDADHNQAVAFVGFVRSRLMG